MRLWRRWLLLIAVTMAQEFSERKAALVVCVQLTNSRLNTENEKVDKLVEDSNGTREEVMTKVMIGMVKQCAETIPMEAVDELMRADDIEPLLFENMQYVPFTLHDYSQEESVKLTEDEKAVVHEVQAIIRESEEFQDKAIPASKSPPVLTQIIILLAVFGAIAAVILFGLKKLRKEAPRRKKKKGD